MTYELFCPATKKVLDNPKGGEYIPRCNERAHEAEKEAEMITDRKYDDARRKAEINARWIAAAFKNHAELGSELRTAKLLAMAKNLIGNIETLHAHDREAELVETIRNLKAEYILAKRDFDDTLHAWQADEGMDYSKVHAASEELARVFARLEQARHQYASLKWGEEA